MLLRSQKIIVTFGAWELVSLALLAILNSLLYEYLFVLDLLGLLVIVQIMSPYMITPRWRSMLNIAMIVGVVIFALLVFNKALYLLGMHHM
jgi:hypothetical protein